MDTIISIALYCPICKEFYAEVSGQDLKNGIRINCKECNCNVALEDFHETATSR
jgi:transposase-like protein